MSKCTEMADRAARRMVFTAAVSEPERASIYLYCAGIVLRGDDDPSVRAVQAAVDRCMVDHSVNDLLELGAAGPWVESSMAKLAGRDDG